jgi:phage repressor protein C with HTH and peptisase S24 domain
MHIWNVQNALMNEVLPDYAVRLQEARARRGFLSARAAAEFFGWKYDSYIQHENGTRGIGRVSAKYAKAFRVSEAWLLTGEGQPGSDLIVPHLTWVSAGAMMTDDVADEAIGTVEVAGLPAGDWFALTVRGDSMDRISPPDSVIFVNRADRSLVANACYVIGNGEGMATYKRYRPDPMRFEPVSTNPAHEPIFPDNEPTIVGRVGLSMIKM